MYYVQLNVFDIILLLITYYICFLVASAMKVERFVDKSYKNNFMKAVYTLRQQEEFTDVALKSGEVHIRCHRVVLAAASEYFKAMFRCGLQENATDTVQLTMEPDIVISIINYMYTGEIEMTVDNVESLVKACDILQLDALKVGCEDFMMSQVDLTNCVGFYSFAALYRLHQVQRKAKGMIMADFKTVAFNDEFKQLSCSQLVDCIKDDDMIVDDEDVVVECVLDWVHHDLLNRKSSFEAILGHVRLPYCTGHYLRHMMDTCDLLTPKCMEYVHEAMSFQVDTVHQHEISSCRTVPRSHFRVKSRLVVVGGLFCSQDNTVVENNICQYFNESTSCWETLTKMPQSVGRYYSVCYVGRSLLVTGGYKGGVAVNECWLYDFVTKKWEAMAPLITARYYHSSVTMGDCVHVIGGRGADKTTVLASVECFSISRRQWSRMPDLQQAVRVPVVVTYGNKIFVFGGRDAANKDVRCTQVLDSTRGQCTTQSDMIEACSFGAAVTMNNIIYVVGGHYRSCLKYDPATNTWTKLGRPLKEHGIAPAVVWRGCILVSGGGGNEPESSVIEQYDPLTDSWCDWKTTLDAKQTFHAMFHVDLYDA